MMVNCFSFIQTKYVLVVPDAVRLTNVEMIKNLDYNKLQRRYQTTIVAFPVGEEYHCSKLNIDLR